MKKRIVLFTLTATTLLAPLSVVNAAASDNPGWLSAEYTTVRDNVDMNKFSFYYDRVQLTSDNEACDKINQSIKADSDNFFSENYDSVKEMLIDDESVGYPYTFDDGTVGYYTNVQSVSYNKNGILSICGNWNCAMAMGIPVYGYRNLNYDLRTGEKLLLTDVFDMSKTDLENYLKSFVYAVINESPSSFYLDQVDALTLDDLDYFIADEHKGYYDWANYNGECVVLCFDRYEIADGSAGSFEIPCPIINSKLGKNVANNMLTPSDWAAAEVKKADEHGITNGLDQLYHEYITREEFAKLIVNCIDSISDLDKAAIKANNTIKFTDTDNDDVCIAAGIGIVNGVGDNLYAPKQKITRQEIAVMVYRAIKYVENANKKSYVSEKTGLQSFNDASSVSDWASQAVGVLANNDIMKGTSETTLSPLSNTTKEQAILLTTRIYELMK